MDFAALPPEITSARMYAGPGSGPMLAAASSWDGLAAELHSTALVYESVISVLASEAWQGPASAAMTAAATPYVTWLHTTAGQAERTAMQAKAAAAAYEAAFVATVPPPVIAANRAQLTALVATNLLGQNAAAIAANEALYGELWAQDAAAMYTYAGSSATATGVTPFHPAPKTTNEAGLLGQAAAAAKDTGTASTQELLSRLTSATPGMLQRLASPLQAAPQAAPAPLQIPIPGTDLVLPDLIGLDAIAVTGAAASITGAIISGAAWGSAGADVHENKRRLDHLHAENHEELAILGHPRPDYVQPGDWPWTVDAHMGQAGTAGGLSVPPGWAAPDPQVRVVAYALPMAGIDAAPAVTGASGAAFREMALAGMVGRALAGGLGAGGGFTSAAGPKRIKTSTGSPAGASPDTPAAATPVSVTGIAAEIRELAELRDAGILTHDEFNGQKRRLLGL